MSAQEIPEIPGLEPDAVSSLMKLCSGPEGKFEIARQPNLVELNDELYTVFTDLSTVVLLKVEGEVPNLPSTVSAQEEFSNAIQSFSEGDLYEDVDAETILAWCRESITVCPKCKGSKTCMFVRHHMNTSTRENPDVISAHTGRVVDGYYDRRRIELALKFLGVDEGAVDVVVSTRKDHQDLVTHCLTIIGENWRVYTAGLLDPVGEAIVQRRQSAPALELG